MPTSRTIISNMALAHCGISQRISDVDTENSPEAIQCRLFFDHCRDMILEAQAWPFATQRVRLQLLTLPEEWEGQWTYRYAYPNICKRVNKIVNPAMRTETESRHRIPFQVIDRADAAGKAILCDQDNALVEFNVQINDVGRFSASFVQAFALCLAAHITTPLKVNAEITRTINARYTDWLTEAILITKAERQDDPEPDSQFVNARC